MRRTYSGVVPSRVFENKRDEVIKKACCEIIQKMSVEELEYIFEVTESEPFQKIGEEKSNEVVEFEVSLFTSYNE